MMGTGFLKAAARTMASSWVLSPISPSATTPVDTRNASKQGLPKGCCTGLRGRGCIALIVRFAATAPGCRGAARPLHLRLRTKRTTPGLPRR